MIEYLPDAPSTVDPPEFAGPEHPMRKVTVGVAFDDAWDAERRTKVQALFDGMADTWTADHESDIRLASLVDALDRGQVGDPTRILELGSGSGLGTGILHQRFPGRTVALDLAYEMLRNAPADYAPRVQGDATALPIPENAVDAVVMVNALLFPAEVDRVLAPDGVVVWVNTVGPATPIHLPAADVAAALPGDWSGLASRAGSGTWTVLRRQ